MQPFSDIYMRFDQLNSGLFIEIGLKFRHGHQDLPGTGTALLTDNACFRKLVHDAGRPVKADLENTLQKTNRSLVFLDDKTPRLYKVLIASGIRLHFCLR